MAQIFRTQRKVRFADCDAAGQMFYPRALEMVNGVIEDWFADALDYGFKAMHLGDGLGIPTVRLDVEFLTAAPLGDVLDFALAVAALGRSSADLHVVATCNDEKRFVARLRVVFARLETRKSVPIPGPVRAAMEPYLSDTRGNDRGVT